MNERIKRQTYTHIPVYSGDVSGAASALYEFGGMTVIHDPSGCNSTYNTHDELRWYRKESAIYISGLRESDAIAGNDSRLINDTINAALSAVKKPAFIALCNSPVPDIIGTDFASIAKTIEARTGIRTFYVNTNAMHDYTRGAANAFLSLAETFIPPKTEVTTEDHAISLLGLTPFEYPDPAETDRLFDLLSDYGFKVCANWGMGSALHPVGFSDVSAACAASASLVLSSTGIRAAEYLYKSFGIPYVIGNPLASDSFAAVVCDDLRKACCSREKINACLSLPSLQKAMSPASDPGDALSYTAFIGEPVTMGSEAAAFSLTHPDRKIHLICTTGLTDGLVSADTVCPHGEAEIAESLFSAEEIHGDPFLKNAVSNGHKAFDPSRQTWIDEPHLALSGRYFFTVRP